MLRCSKSGDIWQSLHGATGCLSETIQCCKIGDLLRTGCGEVIALEVSFLVGPRKSQVPSGVIKHGSGKSTINEGVHRKITCFYGPFSSTPCLITGGYRETTGETGDRPWEWQVMVQHVPVQKVIEKQVPHAAREKGNKWPPLLKKCRCLPSSYIFA